VANRSNGMVLWQGQGFNAAAVVAVLTGLLRPSSNRKTGQLLQVWVLPADVSPVEAVRTGRDDAVCGGCRYRGGQGCYVNVGQAPLAVWEAWRADAYPEWDGDPGLFRGRLLRWGAYGDPAILPIELVRTASGAAAGHTGYTHAWRTCDRRFRFWLMASVDTPRERRLALEMGWRTYRVRRPGDRLLRGEFECPASEEQDFRLTCAECRACGGGLWTGQATPAILPHGPRAGRIGLPVV